MDNYEKKQQTYTKWDNSIWLSVEKEISQFQDKVLGCMLSIGALEKTKPEDYRVEPCLDEDVILGDEMYNDIIRPLCVSKGYLPKQIPTEEDLNEDGSGSDEQNSHKPSVNSTRAPAKKEEKPKEPKKGGKKGSKNNQQNNRLDNNHMKIIKENLTKDFQIILSSHSLQNFQIQHGLKSKRLQMKLITLFYVAYYIRKNKERQRIDDSEVFELINILVKIIRIFDKFRGKGYSSSNAEDKKKREKQVELTEVSPTLILDLKMCVKGLKQYYKYTNKKIIINYPKLVYYTSYDRFFPTLDIKPYESQIEFIQSVKKAFNLQKGTLSTPTLILYKTMIGSGKTSASMCLSNLIAQTKTVDAKNMNLQVIYSCVIGSVRIQVGRNAYNKAQKFALAAMIQSQQNEDFYYPRVINSYRFRNQNIVDLMISDLDCTYEMLATHHHTQQQKEWINYDKRQREKKRKDTVKIGKVDKQNIVLFIDEPTAFCKDTNSVATRNLFKILANYPPRLIILASATMPSKEDLKNTIKLIEQRNPGLQVFQVDSKEFQIGCQYSSFKGEIIFPHTGIKDNQHLRKIIEQIDRNPFLMRLYTGPSLYFLLKKCEQAGVKNLPKIDQLPQIKQKDISNATLNILNKLSKCEDSIIQEVCKLSADEANLDFKACEKESDSDDDIFGGDDEEKQNEEKSQDKEKEDYVNFKNMLRKDAHKFLGGCLIATDNPLKFAHQHFEKWLRIRKREYIKPIRRLLQKYQRDVAALDREIRLLEDDDKRDDIITKQISKLQAQRQPKMQFPDTKKINTIDHYAKYCVNKQPVHMSMLIRPMPIQLVAEQLVQQVEDFVLALLLCGIALYMEKGLSTKYLDKVEELASQNYLAYIITDRSLCYGTNFPISNVILCDDLAEKLNMNQMFQLIGRAGRVGQSWTARAFLQEKGLMKLNEYIHGKDKKMSEEAMIFETIAQEYLDNPELSLRTTKSEIRYASNRKGENRISITIKKKEQKDYLYFKNVSVVPYLPDGRVLTKKMPYKSINYYEVAQSEILYEDMPTKLNSLEQQIIDVESYYKNEQEFIRKTLNNACKRIVEANFSGKVSVQNQVNEFKPKVYEDYFSKDSNTFAILIKANDQAQINGFAYNRLVSNPTANFDEILQQKINSLVRLSKEIAGRIRNEPQTIIHADVKQIKLAHENIIQRQKMLFYKQMYTEKLPQIQKEYSEITKNIQTELELKPQMLIALFASKYPDFKNAVDRQFHVDPSIREVWQHLDSVVCKQ